MHIHSLNAWQHSHRFNADDVHGERNTKRVILLTLFMMVIEISAGYLFGSMALLAIVTHFPKSPMHYKKRLSAYDEINHVTVEVIKCDSEPCIIPDP